MTCPLRILASADALPLRADVEALVRRCHELGVRYASDDWSPLSDITLGLLLKRAGIQWRYCELEHAGEIVWPPVCGIHLLQLDRYQSRLERRFALRHGLAHVLAGHVADLTYAHDGHHWENSEEQLADAFALADLIPDRMLCEMQAGGFRDKGLERWVRAQISHYAPDWPEGRVTDRADTQMGVR
jgi:hypothetical protein